MVFLIGACGSDDDATGDGGGGGNDGGGGRLDTSIRRDTGVTLPDSTTGTDSTTTTDGFVANDTTVGPTCDGSKIGQRCTGQDPAECGEGGTCLQTSESGGICTCACIPDDPATQFVNENTCPTPATQICGDVTLSSGQTQNFCFKSCQPKLGGNDCTAPIACNPRAASVTGTFDTTVCLAEGCTEDADCPVVTGEACDPSATDPCGAGNTCLEITATTGVCAEPGNCDTDSGLCGAHAVEGTPGGVGAPCTSDKQCGEYMSCERELDPATLGLLNHGQSCTSSDDCCGVCGTGGTCEGSCAVHARNGYCLISGCTFATTTDFNEFACPTGSTCNKLFFGGICMKTCDLATATDCRGNGDDKLGDYECRAWDNLTIGGEQLAAEPICDFGDIVPCSLFQGSTLDCSALGTVDPQDPNNSNTTNMRCRLLTGADTTQPLDPQGFCLDDTASGDPA